MFRKKIAVLLTAVMTISTIGTTAFAAPEDKIDAAFGSVVKNGFFEQTKDGWTAVTGTSIERVINDTYDGSAGSALIKQTTASQVTHQTYAMTADTYYHASAYVKLKNANSDYATFFVKQGNNTFSIEDVEVTDDWSLVEFDFQSKAASDAVIYIKCDTETEFYLDNVKIVPLALTWSEGNVVSGENAPEGAEVALKVTGNSAPIQSIAVTANVTYDFSASVMLDANSTADAATAKMAYKKAAKGTTYYYGETETLVAGEWVEVSCTAVISTATGSRNVGVTIEGAGADDVIYIKDFRVTPNADDSAAEVTSISIENMLAGNDTDISFAVNSDTVAVRHFYMVADSADATEWTVIESYLTDIGTKTISNIFINAEYAGKYIKLRIDPMDKYGRFGASAITAAAAITDKITITQIDSNEGTTTLTLTNTMGENDKAIAVIVAYYNSNDEIIAVGIDNKVLDDGEGAEFAINVSATDIENADYTKIYICEGGETDADTMALAPLTGAEEV